MQNHSNREITFDTQLKTALWRSRFLQAQVQIQQQSQEIQQLREQLLVAQS